MRGKIVLLLVVFLAACQHGPVPKTPPAAAEPVAPVEEPKSAVASYPRGTKLSAEFAKALRALGAKTARRGSEERMRVRDLSCAMDMSKAGAVVCEFFDDIAGKKKIRSGPAADEMRMRLFGFPVSQGDPGAATPWLECDRYDGHDTCTIAVMVDYEGP